MRGLRTTATLDTATDEWVLETPELGATKWWSTALPMSTHAIVFAQLITPDGASHGLQMFMVQLRGAGDLEPLPGIELGDLGRLAGENDATIGYLRLHACRVPRRHLLERRQHVSPDGRFCLGAHPGSMDGDNAGRRPAAARAKPDPKIAQAVKYVTMMKTRIALASTAAGALAKACVIAARYSCVRRQGFRGDALGAPTKPAGDHPHLAREHQIIDYSVQRYRVLKWVSHAFAIKCATQWMIGRRHEVERAAKVSMGRPALSPEP